MSKVFIVGGGMRYAKMFLEQGFDLVDNVEDADLIQFTGGADVSPHLYGEDAHPNTFSDPQRDEYEMALFRRCVNLNKPMTGVCRGGQFLNVMSGGRLYQDVRGHGINGHHACLDLTSGEVFPVTSTHHQMMRLGQGGILLAAIDNMGRNKQAMSEDGVIEFVDDRIDVEAVFYPATKCLCFQPHPEFACKECSDMYFKYINEYLLRD